MGDDDINSAENARRKRLKTWALISCGVSGVAGVGLTVVMWGHGAEWSRSARHGWQDFFELVLGCSMAWQLMLMQKADWKAAPSPLSTLELSQQMEGQVKPLHSEHWSGEGGSGAR
jgi:hypothetical protein